jgi:hypothetical protein
MLFQTGTSGLIAKPEALGMLEGHDQHSRSL